jgi:formylglycine-generating enzyme required for sulfatase activity
MKLILIPPGDFRMGSEETDQQLAERFPYLVDEMQKEPELKMTVASARPQHWVRITRPFYSGKYEVTKGQFRSFVDDTGYATGAETDGRGGWGYDSTKIPINGEYPFYQATKFNWRNWGVDQSDDCPVVNVSWNDATAFCDWLSRKEQKKYRLPTEAEWEYACRAGTTSRFYGGDDPEILTRIGNVADSTGKSQFPWWSTALASADGSVFPNPVGQFRPNNFGLFDMAGNVNEWCQDWFGELYYRDSPASDPAGPSSGSHRVIRGGGWDSEGVYCRSAARFFDLPTRHDHRTGFRIVCEAADSTAARRSRLDAPTAKEKQAPTPTADGCEGHTAGQIRDDNPLKTRLVWIPPGDFTMGSPNHEADRGNDESQVHVSLTRGFWLGQHEVTQAEWRRLMATTPWSGKECVTEGDDYPATYVTWDEALRFCEIMTTEERAAGRLPEGWFYTMPTEAQWEYACRTGTTSRFSFGDSEGDLREYAWYSKNGWSADERYPHQVARKKANPWGLYDMHGNVWEWCRDWYTKELPGGTDPQGPPGSLPCVRRGGSWGSAAHDCRSASRETGDRSFANSVVGFRMALCPYAR